MTAGAALLIAVGALVFLTFGALPAPAQQQSGSYAFPIQVTSVDLRTDGPGPVALDVEGVIPNGCSRFEQVVQWREGNQIVVRVLARNSGAEVCTMIAQIYRDTTIVDGPLPPGDYGVDVNGVARQVHVD
jgi:hypothetical protein